MALKHNSQEHEPRYVARSDDVLAHLERVLSHPPFSGSERLATFLQYVVTETMEGRAKMLKQFSIGIDVFNRDESFDPAADPIVRIQAGRVRRALAKYYEEKGAQDKTRITIPVGSYVPEFARTTDTDSAESASVQTGQAPVTSLKPTIAVLPFADQSYEPLPEYLINGMLEELSAELAAFPSLNVVSYNSALSHHESGAPPVTQALELGADYALLGTFRADAQEMRVTLHLLDTNTRKKVWSRRELKALEPGEKPLADYRMIRRLASLIADTFGVVQRLQLESAKSQDRASAESYESILAFHQYTLSITPESFARAISLLEKAALAEPDNAAVNAKLALLYLDAKVFGFSGVPENSYELAVRLARRARAQDPLNQQVHFTNAFASLVERDRLGVIRSAERIVEINPNAAYMKGAASFFLATAGEYERAESLFEDSLDLNPFYPTWFHYVPFIAAFQRKDYDVALTEAREFAIPGFFWTHIVMAAALAKEGQLDKAAIELQRLLEQRPDMAVTAEKDVSLFALDEKVALDLLDGLRLAGLQVQETATLSG